MLQSKRTSVIDLLTRTGAESSKTPTVIIPEFLYLGDAKTACWFPHHLSNKITHIINLSGCSNFWDTKEKILKFRDQQSSDQFLSLEKDNALSNRNSKILVDDEIIPLKYLRIDIADDPSANISKYFRECIDFIENVRSTNGRIYVHCQAGISRSVTIVIAYLMNSQKISYKQALDLVKERRPNVKPNYGFTKQLQEFEKEIFKC
jgi:protein-tyrosine phosphatase